MPVIRLLVVSSVLFASATSALASRAIDTSRLNLVEENHAVLSRGGDDYVLDSYIVLFERPYYIHVRKVSGALLAMDEAASIAAEYIGPRGCTTPISRRPDLDQVNAAQTQRLIGIEC